MTCYCEPEKALAAMRHKFKVFADKSKDTCVQEWLATSPPLPRRLMFSRSLDTAEQRLSKPTQEEGGQEVKPTATVHTPLTRVIKFNASALSPRGSEEGAASPTSPSFVFKPVPVAKEVPKANGPSVLAELVKQADEQSDAASREAQEEVRMLSITIYLTYGRPLRVKVPAGHTVAQTIYTAIKQHEAECRYPQLTPIASAYVLRPAESDGTSSGEVALNSTAKIDGAGSHFTMVPNLTRRPSNAGKRASMNPPGHRPTMENKILVKIIIEGEHGDQVSSHVMDKDETVRDLIVKTCTRRKLNPDLHHFESEQEELVDEETPVTELRDQMLRLAKNRDLLGIETFMTDRKAIQLETYNVLKLRRGFGGNQERVLGIDGDQITNSVPSGKRKQQVKREGWLIQDLLSARVDPAKKKRFFLVFREDSKKGSKEYHYEAESARVAKRILAKLHHLLDMTSKGEVTTRLG